MRIQRLAAAVAIVFVTAAACAQPSRTPYDTYSSEVEHDPGYNPAGSISPLSKISATAVEGLICSESVRKVDRGLAILEGLAGGEAYAIYHAGRILKAYCNNEPAATALIFAVGQRYGRAMVFTIPQ